ncbi:MAG: MarR family winged helix-turn-helix transcriptional regulator [Anaerotignum sp.]
MDVQKIRSFNRYYARILGIFDKKFLGMEFSVAEVRIIGEIGRNPKLTAKDLASYLSVDKGYMSRMLQNLEKQGLIWREKSEKDAREKHLRLTEAGERLNAILEEKADRRILRQIQGVDEEAFRALLDAMEKIEEIMGNPVEEKEQGGI